MSDITGRPVRLDGRDYVPPKHKNGLQSVTLTPTPPAPLPEAHQQDLEATLRDIYAVRARNEDQAKTITDQNTEIAALKAANMMMESAKNASESRVVSYQLERDQAVSELAELRGKYETVFESMRVLIERFVPPAVTEPLPQ